MTMRLISLNVDSIASTARKNLLYDFIASCPAEFYLLQETKLDSDIKLFIPHYRVVRTDVRKGFGGTAIILRNGISFRNYTYSTGEINFTSIEVKLSGYWCRIVSVYATHGSSDPANCFARLFSGCQPIIFGGDFNARHLEFGDHTVNTYGVALVNSSHHFDISIHNPPAPTCYHSADGSFIDKFISQHLTFPLSSVDCLPSFSDHAAIAISVFANFNVSNEKQRRVKLFHQCDFDSLNKEIDEGFSKINLPLIANVSPEFLDNAAITIESIFTNAINKHVPTTKQVRQQFIPSLETRSLQTRSRRLQRARFNLGADGPTHLRDKLSTEIRLLRNMIANSISRDTSCYFGSLYDSVHTVRDSYKFIRQFTGLKSKPSQTSGLFSDPKKTTCFTEPAEVANKLGELFAANHSLTINDTSVNSLPAAIDYQMISSLPCISFDDRIFPNIETDAQLAAINEIMPTTSSGLFTSAEELAEIIQSRPNKKSTGSDEMPYPVIKRFSPEIILFLTTFFNHCIACAHFPDIWKNAIITPSPKPGKDASVLLNWRPISQLSCLSKIYEKVIMGRLTKIICTLPILQNQFGFLAQHSTEHALARIQSDIDDGLNRGFITSMLCIDQRAAFDVTWHMGLIHKLCKLGINPFLIKVIQSFLANRRFKVRLNDFVTNDFVMPAGVPQGSVSGPTLYNVYIHDLPLNDKLVCTQFADDTTYHSVHNNPKLLQTIFNSFIRKLCCYFKEWKMALNASKTEFINIVGQCKDTNAKLRKNAKEMKIVVDGNTIEHAKSVRVLGLHFQSNARFNGHIRIRLKKARTARYFLNRFFKRRAIPDNIKSKTYKLYVRPILTYASPIWCRQPHTSSHQMELIRTFERSFRDRGTFKHINSSCLYAKATTKRIDRFMVDRSVKFYAGIASSTNPKFKRIIRNRPLGRYPPINYLHAMLEAGLLVCNDQISIFNTRYDGCNGLVYSMNQ